MITSKISEVFYEMTINNCRCHTTAMADYLINVIPYFKVLTFTVYGDLVRIS